METYHYKILSLRYPHALLVYVYPTKAAPLYTKPLVCPPPPHTHCRAEAAAGLGMLQMGKIVMFLRVLRQRQTDRRTDTQSSLLRRPPCSTSPKASHNIISTNNTLNVPHTQYMHVKIIIFLHELHGSFCNSFIFLLCLLLCMFILLQFLIHGKSSQIKK